MEKLLLIDGHSILHRAFYGMPDLTNAAGVHTGAVYGFLSILFRLLEEEKPDYLTVAFDVHAPTFRHEVYAAYKGTRSPMPEELRTQVPLIKEVLTAMDICVAEQAGLEADDILGTLAYRAEAAGMDVTLVSGDRDLLQIATDRILIRIPKTQRGQTTILNYHTQDVIDAYRVTPRQFIEVKALMGDASDNVPGIPKVGEKTATELIVKYGSVEGVYEHLDEITKPALKKSLEENRELADLSLFLVTIKTDCEVALDKDRARIRNFYTPAAYELFSRLGFRNFLGRFESDAKTGGEQALSYDIVFEKKSLEELLEEMGKAEAAAVYPLIDADAYGLPAELVGFAAATKDRTCFVQIKEGLHNSVDAATAANFFQKLRARAAQDDDRDDGFFLYSWNLKRAFPYLGIGKSEFSDGIKLAGIVDCHLAAYLLNPLPGSYQPEDMCRDYLDRTEITEKELLNKRSFREAHMADEEAVETYACRIARALLEAGPVLRRRLNELKMWQLYVEIERPVAYILYDMQRLGIRVDPAALRNYGEELTDRIEELDRRIHEEAGDPDFNIASPKQLGAILFEKMRLPGGKKTKSGYSTAADVLEKLAPDYPFVANILEYRGLTKLKSTYAEGLYPYIAPDMRIHASFHQTVTATGRLSASDPNLQNIPMRTELGKKIRKCFLPREGWRFTDADYSQIELRLLAHMSGDEGLIEAYRENEDIHRITASKVFHTPFEEVTPAQRSNAKAVNFGIVYGISSFGLSQGLSITRKEAAEYIDAYFRTYPGVKAYLDALVAGAKETGAVTTLYGRIRPIPELKSSNFMQRQFGERVAMNSPLQGTAADIMKIAMIRVWEALRREGLKSEMILQIHDELLIETAPGEEKRVKEILENEMKHAADLKVTLEVNVEDGSDWYGTK